MSTNPPSRVTVDAYGMPIEYIREWVADLEDYRLFCPECRGVHEEIFPWGHHPRCKTLHRVHQHAYENGQKMGIVFHPGVISPKP